MKWLTRTVILLAAISLTAADDKLLLKDGQTVTGKILSVTANDVQIDTGEETMRVPRWAIETIEREGGTAKSVQTTNRRSRHKIPPRAKLESTPALDTWIDTLIEKLASGDEGVRLTANSALRTAGPAAHGAIKQAVESDDEMIASGAKRILSHIEFVMANQSTGVESIHDRDFVGELMTTIRVTEAQAPEFKQTMDEFYAKQDEITAAIRAREILASEGGKQISELRSSVDRKMADLLTDQQMKLYRASVPRAMNRTSASRTR